MESNVEIFRGSVYLVRLPDTGSSVTRGVRECVIFSNNASNANAPIIQVVPITFAAKRKLPTHHEFIFDHKVATALGENIMCTAKENAFRYLGEIEPEDMIEIEKCIAIQLGLIRREKNNGYKRF